MSQPTRKEMIDALRLEAMQNRRWADQREEANKNPRSPRKWAESEIVTIRRRAEVFEHIAGLIEAQAAKATPKPMEVD